jgi:hypothetical protein
MKGSCNKSPLIRLDVRMHPICITLRLIIIPEHVRVIVRKLIPVWTHCILRWARFSIVAFIIDHNVHIIVVEVMESSTLLFIAGKGRGSNVGVRIL